MKMKIKKNFNYSILCIIFFIGIIIGYSPNFQKIKNYSRVHAPMGIELILLLSYLDDAIHYDKMYDLFYANHLNRLGEEIVYEKEDN